MTVLLAGPSTLIRDGNSEIGASVWSVLDNLICLGHLFRSIVNANLIFSLYKCVMYSGLPYGISTMMRAP